MVLLEITISFDIFTFNFFFYIFIPSIVVDMYGDVLAMPYFHIFFVYLITRFFKQDVFWNLF